MALKSVQEGSKNKANKTRRTTQNKSRKVGIYEANKKSPNYPNNYPTNTCWDYVIRSPYRCPTKFHIQFLDFHLESSTNCTQDYLAIGLENDGDDMDLLCGQVIGIKKYHTPDGILRLRFLSDGSPWTAARGFKLLITRLACEREDYLRELLDGNDEDTEEVLAPTLELKPPQGTMPQLFRNLTQTEQHIPYPTQPLFGWNLPERLPGYLPGQFPVLQPPPPPALGGLYAPLPNRPHAPSLDNNKPCIPEQALGNPYPPYPQYPAVRYRSNDAQQPLSADQYVAVLPPRAQSNQQQARESENKSQADLLAKSVNEAQPRQQFGGGALFGSPFNSFHSTIAQLSSPQLAGAPFAGGAPQLDATAQNPTPQGGASVEPAITSASAQQCCTSSFHQKRFYLSSPGFPRTAFTSLLPAQQRDCKFVLEKHADNICRLRIEFKFFDFGQSYAGTGDIQGNVNVAISTTKDVCTEDYIEIDGARFCGCRTGYIYTSPWGLGAKQIRMRMGYSGIPSSGFLLEIYQEECQETAFVKPPLPAQDALSPASGVQTGGTQGNTNVGQHQNLVGNQNPLNTMPQNFLSQQQLPLYQQPPYFTQPAQAGLPLDQIPYRPLHTGGNFNPFLAAQQQQQQQLWSPPFPPPYTDLAQQYPPFGLSMPFYRHARTSDSLANAASTYKPMTVVETNSTRKEYYYFDGDEAFGRLRANDEPDDLDRNGVSPEATVRDRCSFSTMDALRLTVDSLWITKPTCYAPLRSWFSNIFGG
ncbi:uncharacterized protein LOC118741887 [Rhagoletis pomonella]|uniref:uncharacterized protein LOC118741887 n=1 Tax=Rhagoletis pomonella TaxID=28610 RepID=UPI00178452AE|nr:uncharacterized protein LOC118741887 [Rhagoletis pomonella]